MVLFTQGKMGATAFDGRRMYRQGIEETEVVDTLGRLDTDGRFNCKGVGLFYM